MIIIITQLNARRWKIDYHEIKSGRERFIPLVKTTVLPKAARFINSFDDIHRAKIVSCFDAAKDIRLCFESWYPTISMYLENKVPAKKELLAMAENELEKVFLELRDKSESVLRAEITSFAVRNNLHINFDNAFNLIAECRRSKPIDDLLKPRFPKTQSDHGIQSIRNYRQLAVSFKKLLRILGMLSRHLWNT